MLLLPQPPPLLLPPLLPPPLLLLLLPTLLLLPIRLHRSAVDLSCCAHICICVVLFAASSDRRNASLARRAVRKARLAAANAHPAAVPTASARTDSRSTH
jgi:hypothetical protein